MKYIEFVKKYAKDKKITYKEALKQSKDAWKKHKETSPEHKGKKTKSHKSKQVNKKKVKSIDESGIKMTIKEKAKARTLGDKVLRDMAQKSASDKIRSMDEYLDLVGRRKTRKERVDALKATGMADSDATTQAKKDEAELEVRIASKKPMGAGLPMDIDPKMLVGARKTLIARYKKLKAKVDKALEDGEMPKEYNTLVELTKKLAGKSKTNNYAKYLKKLTKKPTTKATQKKMKSTAKKISKVELKAEARAKAVAQKLEKNIGSAPSRAMAQQRKDITSKRIEQLIRLGATPDEANKIANEESRSMKEQQDLQRQLQIAKVRGGVGARTQTGGMSYQDFIKKTAKEKKVDYNTANTIVKNNNLFLKYQVSQVQQAQGNLGQITALPIPTPTPPSVLPPTLAGRSKYINKDGSINQRYVSMATRLAKKYSGATNFKEMYGKERNVRAAKVDYKQINELAQLPIIPNQAELKQLDGLLNDYIDFGRQQFLDAKKATQPLPRPASPTSPTIKKKTTFKIKKKKKPAPAPTGSPPARRRGSVSLPPLADRVKAEAKNFFKNANQYKDIKGVIKKYADGDIDLAEFESDFVDRRNNLEQAFKALDAQAQKGQAGLDLQSAMGWYDGALNDIDNEGLSRGSTPSGSGLDYHPYFYETDLDAGGSLKDYLSKKKLEYTNTIGRTLERIPMPVNALIRGVGKVAGRNARTADTIDEEDKEAYYASTEQWEDAEDRKSIGDYRIMESDPEHAVFVDEKTGKGLLVYRGSYNAKDWKVSDVNIGKGNFKNDERLKRETQWTNQMIKKYPTIKFTTTGYSLGGTLAIFIADTFKIPSIPFNAGVGIDYKDYGKDFGDNDVKFYHSKGDIVSALGLGQFKNSVMINNKAGNIFDAHRAKTFVDHAYAPLPDRPKANDNELPSVVNPNPDTSEIDNVRPTNPAAYGDQAPTADAEPQINVEPPRPMDYRDVETFTGEFGAGLNLGVKKTGGALSPMSQIKNVKHMLEGYEMNYNPNEIDKQLLGAGLDEITKYNELKSKHDKLLNGIQVGLKGLQRMRDNSTGGDKEILSGAVRHLGNDYRFHKFNTAPYLKTALQKSLSSNLQTKNLSDLQLNNGGGLYDLYKTFSPHHKKLRREEASARFYGVSADRYRKHMNTHANNYKVSGYDDYNAHSETDQQHNNLATQLGKLVQYGGQALLKKLGMGGSLSSNEHRLITQYTGLTAPQLTKNPHFDMIYKTMSCA